MVKNIYALSNVELAGKKMEEALNNLNPRIEMKILKKIQHIKCY